MAARERLRGHRLSRRELLLRLDRGLLPDTTRARLRLVRQVRPRLHRPRGVGEDERADAEEGHARLERRRRRTRDGDHVPEGGQGQVHRPAALQLLHLAERQGHEGRKDGRGVDVLRLQLERELDALARDRRRGP